MRSSIANNTAPHPDQDEIERSQDCATFLQLGTPASTSAGLEGAAALAAALANGNRTLTRLSLATNQLPAAAGVR